MGFNKNIDPTTVNNYHGSFAIILLSIKYLNLLTRLINDTNKFESDLILEINSKMSQEKY